MVGVAAFRAPRAYWWLALAFAVSFLADTASHFVNSFWVSRVYPVSQAALVAAVFLARKDALGILAMLVLAGLAGVFLEPKGPELFTHLVCWLTAAAIASEEAPQPVKRALTVYFGWGVLAWVCYVIEPGWASWGFYQGTRLVGIALFGLACWKPAPQLRLT